MEWHTWTRSSRTLWATLAGWSKHSKWIRCRRPWIPNGATTNSTAEISNILNLYFKSVFVEEDSTSPIPELNSRTSQRIEEVSLNVADISTRLGLLDQHKAPGDDGVHPLVLKACHAEMAIPLSIIFFKSLQEGSILCKWRVANVTPLHKKGTRLDPANYRPVSLTSIPCKILERIIRDTVLDHL